jgi:hypothetical protein
MAFTSSSSVPASILPALYPPALVPIESLPQEVADSISGVGTIVAVMTSKLAACNLRILISGQVITSY